MGYKVFYSKIAEKYLDSQPKTIQKRIMDAIDAIPTVILKSFKIEMDTD